jgi:hypothetical protein
MESQLIEIIKEVGSKKKQYQYSVFKMVMDLIYEIPPAFNWYRESQPFEMNELYEKHGYEFDMNEILLLEFVEHNRIGNKQIQRVIDFHNEVVKKKIIPRKYAFEEIDRLARM